MKRCLAVLVLWAGVVLVRAEILIEDPWVRAVPPSSGATAAFMKVTNTGGGNVTLVEARADIAKDVRPMVTTKKQIDGHEVSGMEFVDSFAIAGGKSRVLEPGGDHIMLMKLSSVPAAGTSVKLTLVFDGATGRREIRVEAPVR